MTRDKWNPRNRKLFFFLQLATITCIQIQWLACRPFHCSSDWAAASWLRSAVFSSSEARGAGVFVREKNIVIGSCCRSFFFFAKRSLYTDMPPSITLENCNERLGSEFLANQNAEHNAPKKKKMQYENPRNSESAISEPRSGEGSLYTNNQHLEAVRATRDQNLLQLFCSWTLNEQRM